MPKLTYLGHSGFVVEGGDKRLVIDPFLTGNSLAQSTPADIECDYVLLTHGHADHIGDTETILMNNKATLIAPFEVASYFGNKGADVYPMGIGGAVKFPFGRVKLTVAHHGSTYITDQDWVPMGNPAGILLTIDGKTLYHAGDTSLTLDMKLIGELDKIDVALLPVGDGFTMGLDDAAMAVEFLDADLAVPMHFNTFPLIEVDVESWIPMVEARGKKAKVLAVGETLEY